jgi:hypothetical protein
MIDTLKETSGLKIESVRECVSENRQTEKRERESVCVLGRREVEERRRDKDRKIRDRIHT